MDDLKPGQVYLVTYRYRHQRSTSKPTTRKLRFAGTYKMSEEMLLFNPLRAGARQVWLGLGEVIVMTEVAK